MAVGHTRRAFGAVLLTLLLAGCGLKADAVAPEAPTRLADATPGATTGATAGADPARRVTSRLLASRPHGPDEPGERWVAIATGPAAVHTAWSRFRLPGPPVRADLDAEVVLLAALEEQADCPRRLRRVAAEPAEGLLTIELSVPRDRCRGKSRQRTFVIALSRAGLPRGPFEVALGDERFVVTTVAQLRPPPERPDGGVMERTVPVSQLIAFALPGQPTPRPAGQEVLQLWLRNHGEHDISLTRIVLERWTGHHWKPAAGQPRAGLHPAVIGFPPGGATVAAGEEAVAAQLPLAQLRPGWYRARADVLVEDEQGGREAPGLQFVVR